MLPLNPIDIRRKWINLRIMNPLWSVRKGFLLGTLSASCLVGTSLWAIAYLPIFPKPAPESENMLFSPMIVTRTETPQELAWFFIQFPYVSARVQVQRKNRHTFLIIDGPRHREYVVSLAQRSRRVEIYFENEGDKSQVQVFTPGWKRTVSMNGPRVEGESSQADNDQWMWRNPLWNTEHIKIYALGDLWRDAPYKRFSCAGFMHQFLGQAGVHVPILDAWDVAKQPWARISMDELEPGDVLTIRAASESHRRFWGHRITHVGVYLGNGKFIHAATSSPKARRAFVRIAEVTDIQSRIDKVLRPPELL